jgi:hypothetical protein
MKWFKTWYFGFTLLWIIILGVAWLKGNLGETIKTPVAIFTYFGLTMMILAGIISTFIGVGNITRKLAIIITNKTNLVSRFFEMVGKWILFANNNRDKPLGIYYLFIGLSLLIGSSLLLSYLLNEIKF